MSLQDLAWDWESVALYLPPTHAAIMDASSAYGNEAHINTKEVSVIL